MCHKSDHYVVVVVDHNHNWLHFVKYSIISCSIWNPGICQLIYAPRLHLVREFSEFSGRACPQTPQHVSPWALLMGANAPILYLPSICSTKAYKQKMCRNAADEGLPTFHAMKGWFSSCRILLKKQATKSNIFTYFAFVPLILNQ